MYKVAFEVWGSFLRILFFGGGAQHKFVVRLVMYIEWIGTSWYLLPSRGGGGRVYPGAFNLFHMGWCIGWMISTLPFFTKKSSKIV